MKHVHTFVAHLLKLFVLCQVILILIYLLRGIKSDSNHVKERRRKVNINSSSLQPPNIIFLYADDLGFNDVPWNNKDIVAPNLDKLASKSVILHNYYTYPTCNPSRAALMTGYYKSQSEMPPLNTLTPTGLDTEHMILPQYFKDFGYMSHAIGKWHLGFCKKEYLPTQRGFNSFYGYYNGAETYYTHETQVYRNRYLYDFFDHEEMDYTANGTYSALLFTERSQEIIKKQKSNKPFFLYLAYQNIHMPLEVPPEDHDPYPDLNDSIRKTAMRMVTSMDVSIGEVLRTVKQEGLEENTVIIFASDNGAMTCGGGSNYPLRGGKHTQWEGGVRVPAFVHLPKKYGGTHNGHYTGLFHVVDWLPTLISLMGGDPTSLPGGIDGIDQIQAIKDPSIEDQPRKEVYHIYRYGIGHLRLGDYKVLVGEHIGGDLITPEDQVFNVTKACAFNPEKKTHVRASNNRLEIYNVKDDPGETTPLGPSAETDAVLLRYHDIKCSICPGFESLIYDHLTKEGRAELGPVQKVDEEEPKKDFHVLHKGVIGTGWC